MKLSRSFYRSRQWAIAFPIGIGLLTLGLSLGFAPELSVTVSRWLAYAVAGGVGISLVRYVLLYGNEWAKGMVVSLISFVVFYVLLEGVCGLVLRWRQGQPMVAVEPVRSENKKDLPKPNGLRLVHLDRLGTFRPAPGQYATVYPAAPGDTSKAQRANANRTVTYTIDSLSRRVTPFASRRADKYALFLGCSFTYGEAVADTSTLPYFFGRETGFQPYNYGVSGQSPAHMLALLQTRNLRHEITQKDGVAVYTFITDHLARATPSTFWAHNANGYLPYVNPTTAVVEGTYAQKHPIRMRLIRWMYQSNIVNLFRINFPKRYSTEHYRRFVQIVRKSKELYQKQFGNDRFYVVVFPLYPMDPELRHLFQQAHLEVLDYSAWPEWATAYDGLHPDGTAYQQVAQQVARDVLGRSNRPRPTAVDRVSAN